MRVLVTGATTAPGRSVLDQLLERGLHGIGADQLPAPDRTHEWLRLPSVGDPHYVNELAGLLARHRVDLLIPTGGDLHLVAAANNLPQAVIAPLEAVIAANDRWLTTRRLAAAGIGVPLSVHGWQVSRPVRDLIGEPFVARPRTAGGDGIRVFESWADAPQFTSAEIVAEFIPGTANRADVHLTRDERDDVVTTTTTTTLNSGAQGGETVERVSAPDVAALALAACRELGILGPAEVNIRRRGNGTPVVLGVNARFGAHSHHSPEILDAVLARATVGA